MVSKLAWSLLSPDILLLILLCVAVLLIGRGWMRWGKRVLGFVLFAFLVIALFPVGEWVLAPLELRRPKPRALWFYWIAWASLLAIGRMIQVNLN